MRLKLIGVSEYQIAKELKISQGMVRNYIRAVLEELRQQWIKNAKMYAVMELERLNTIQRTLWPIFQNESNKFTVTQRLGAVDRIIRCIELRAELNGLKTCGIGFGESVEPVFSPDNLRKALKDDVTIREAVGYDAALGRITAVREISIDAGRVRPQDKQGVVEVSPAPGIHKLLPDAGPSKEGQKIDDIRPTEERKNDAGQ